MVAGDVDPQAIARLLEPRLADWTGPAIERAGDPRRSPCQALPGSSCSTGPGPPRPWCEWATPASARDDADFEPAMLVNQILGGQFTSRLNEKLREEKGYTYGVRSHFDTRLGKGPSRSPPRCSRTSWPTPWRISTTS